MRARDLGLLLNRRAEAWGHVSAVATLQGCQRFTHQTVHGHLCTQAVCVIPSLPTVGRGRDHTPQLPWHSSRNVYGPNGSTVLENPPMFTCVLVWQPGSGEGYVRAIGL